jgi:hypothetical protein
LCILGVPLWGVAGAPPNPPDTIVVR